MYSPRFFHALIFFFIVLICQAQHPKVNITAEPAWVVHTNPNLLAEQPEEQSTGFYYLLYENQFMLETKNFFVRKTYKILNSKGVQDMSDPSIRFDPDYQHLDLHKIEIIRNGRVIDKLVREDLQVIQSEAGRDRHLYDGSLTLIANLTDVRVGDVIDYSYTLKGYNPVHKGHYQNTFHLQFDTPLHQLHYAVTIPHSQGLNFKEPASPGHKKTNTPYGTKYTWDAGELNALTFDENTPIWYDAGVALEISQFENWAKVNENYLEYYTISPREREALYNSTAQVIGQAGDSEDSEFIDKAIRFVQDEIRYLGFENGLNSHKPSAPIDVFTRRYGDCKDKSFLLSEILQGHGYKAYPMLVHSTEGRNLDKKLPSVNIFDHCVVQVDLGNGNYRYIDPTISDQGGKITNLFIPDYGYGLVLKKGETSLTKIPQYKNQKTEITETFTLDDVGGGSYMEVSTIYRGYSADFHRKEFNQSSREEIKELYTAFYSSLYPSIESTDPIEIKDNRELNEFTVVEKYRIDSIWFPENEKSNLIIATFSPISLHNFIYPEGSKKRTMPMYVDPYVNVEHRTIVFVPEVFNIKSDDVNINNDDFRYNFKVRYKNARLDILHSYQSLKDHLMPNEVLPYIAEHEKTHENMYYMLRYRSGAIAATTNSPVNWLSIIILFFVMGGTGVGCYFLYQKYDLPVTVKPHWERKLGGLLILLGIGLTLTPIRVIGQFLNSAEYFSPTVWTTLFSEPDTSGLGLLLMMELIYNSAYLVFSIFVVLLFYKRRTIAPRMIIIFLALSFVVSGLDKFLSVQVNPDAYSGADLQTMYLALSRSFIACIIWIPYLIYSQRVRETFVKTKNPAPQPEPVNSIESPIIIP